MPLGGLIGGALAGIGGLLGSSGDRSPRAVQGLTAADQARYYATVGLPFDQAALPSYFQSQFFGPTSSLAAPSMPSQFSAPVRTSPFGGNENFYDDLRLYEGLQRLMGSGGQAGGGQSAAGGGAALNPNVPRGSYRDIAFGALNDFRTGIEGLTQGYEQDIGNLTLDREAALSDLVGQYQGQRDSILGSVLGSLMGNYDPAIAEARANVRIADNYGANRDATIREDFAQARNRGVASELAGFLSRGFGGSTLATSAAAQREGEITRAENVALQNAADSAAQTRIGAGQFLSSLLADRAARESQTRAQMELALLDPVQRAQMMLATDPFNAREAGLNRALGLRTAGMESIFNRLAPQSALFPDALPPGIAGGTYQPSNPTAQIGQGLLGIGGNILGSAFQDWFGARTPPINGA